MATKNWTGGAAVAVAEVSTLTPANVEIGDIFTVTINGKSVSFTAAAATVANVTAGFTSAWNASTIAEFAEVTASDQTTHIRLTVDTPGVSFAEGITASHTDGGGANTQTFTLSTTTAAAGPYCWSSAANWSDGAIPANGDTVNILNSSQSILYGLGQSGVTLAALNIHSSFTGTIGLPEQATTYPEFRRTYLAIGSDAITIGIGDGDGSGRIKIDVGSADTTARVLASGEAAEEGIPPVLLKGTDSANVLEVYGADVGFAWLSGETGALATLRLADGSNGESPSVQLGAGVSTLTAVQQTSGYLATRAAATTGTIYGGVWEHFDGAITALNCYGGTCYYRSSGTVTTANLYRGGDIDLSRDLRSRTITTLNLYMADRIVDGTTQSTPRLYDPGSTLTITNPIGEFGGSLGGANLTFSRSGGELPVGP